MEVSFNVYEYRFTVRGSVDEPVDGIRQDFAFFAAPASDQGVLIELCCQDPPLDDLPDTDAVVYTPRNVVYRRGSRRYIDYHGRALGIQDEETGNLKLYSRDPSLLYEAAYLYLLSQIGQSLDRRGLHRMHALGVVVKDRAVLVLLPMGGGKSTLGLHLVQHPEVKILSDDSPFIDRQGRVFAYPLRLGLLPGSEHTIPSEHRRLIHRMEFGPKHLVNYSYFQDRVAASAAPGLVLIGARTLNHDCRIEDAGRLSGLRACVGNCVVGVGLFQGLEFILRSSGWELLKQTKLGLSRLRNCNQLLRRSRVCRVHLGRDPELNARTVLDFALKM
ncbi:MAG: hypothetical protein ABSH31_02865 [Bryobacteraceae bacterium]